MTVHIATSASFEVFLSHVCDLPDLSLVWITLIIFLVLLFYGFLLKKERYGGSRLSHPPVLLFLPNKDHSFVIFSHTRPNRDSHSVRTSTLVRLLLVVKLCIPDIFTQKGTPPPHTHTQ